MAGLTLFQLMRRFPDEETAVEWFERLVWPNGERDCPRCGSLGTYECSHAKMPYRCRDCGKYFSVKTPTVMAGSPLPVRVWIFAMYLDVSRPKGVSSVQMAKDLGVTQKTAWYMQQRIREAFRHAGDAALMLGPVEADETWVGGLEKNKHARLRQSRIGGPGKTPVAGIRDRRTGRVAARVIEHTDRKTLGGFVRGHAAPGSRLYTDESAAYGGLSGDYDRHSVCHSRGEYVRGGVHTNGIESLWSLLKRAHKGTFHVFSRKHLQRYLDEMCWRNNHRSEGVLGMMREAARGMVGKRLTWAELTA